MKKLKLDMEALRVDRFDVEPEDVGGEGTVVALSGTLWTTTAVIRYCPRMPNTVE